MRRQHKKYQRPKNLFNKERILEEKIIVKNYGLKNKREIWKAEAFIAKIRRTAKQLLTKEESVQELFLEKLRKMGLADKKSKIDDVLDLKKENVLDRRLQTIVFKKGMAKTSKHSRQLIIHRQILIEDEIVNIPSFIVPVSKENLIKLKK